MKRINRFSGRRAKARDGAVARMLNSLAFLDDSFKQDLVQTAFVQNEAGHLCSPNNLYNPR